MRPFTLRELNRATLARQLLLERARLPVPRAVERLCAMQAQSANGPYVGLWSRLDGFDRDQLTLAYERRRVARATLFRVTIQLVSARDHAAFATLMHERWRDEFVNWKLPADEWAERIHALAENGPFTYADANRAVPELPERRRFRVRCLTPLVHVPPAGLWGQVRVRVTTAAQRLGYAPVAHRAAAALLVRRYLAAYGPATKADLLRFAGLRARDVEEGFDQLESKLIRLEADDGRTLYDLRRAPRPAPDTPAPVRFLPEWDHLILAYDDRKRVLPSEYREEVIRSNGDVYRTFLVDGMVAGTWRYEDGKVKPRPLAPLPRGIRRELEDEARRLAAFHA